MKILNVFGDITSDKVTKLLEEVAELRVQGCPEILVIFASTGGEVEAGFDLFDLLRLYPGKKIGLVWRHAKSMASFALQACDKRMVTRHARIMIHHIGRRNTSLEILRSPRRIKRVVSDMERMQYLMYRVYADRSGKTVGQIRKECTREQDMFPQEAKAFGLIDGIWSGPLPILEPK